MMMVQYLLDKDIRPHDPAVDEVESDFKTALEPLELALEQEITVTKQIETLARTARDEATTSASSSCSGSSRSRSRRSPR